MVERPERHFEAIARAGGDSVTFHVEACEDPLDDIAQARSHGLGVGVAFNPETAVEEAARGREGADLVLCMSIHPGYSGQPFMAEAPARIARAARAAAARTCACRSTAGSTPRRFAWRARPARTCSSQAARSSGATIRRGPIRELAALVREPVRG